MKIRNIIIFLIFISLIIGSFFATKYLSQLNNTEITVSTLPADSKKFINGKLIIDEKIYSNSGDILITASKDGYYEYRKIYNITDKNINIPIVLTKKPEKTINELVYSSEYDNLVRQIPIIKYLPFNTFLIKISYSSDSTLNSLTLNINSREGSRKATIDKIEEWGYNPSDYNIKFINYTNPFAL